MKTPAPIPIFILILVFLISACCPINPPQDSVLSAHGNTDWHIDTAEEFLYGTDMSGTTTAANHCPNSWTRDHIHIGQTNANHFYYDDDLATPGDDADTTNGIDQAMLFFYAGHGNPVIWNTLGNNATQSNLLLGNCPGGGKLRYYWQCSCQVFAHGPRNCIGSTHDYACPGDFDGSADSSSMRNVYERWGPALSEYLRMACGASTSAYCHESQMNRIWDNYNNNGFDVADSFIDGLRGSGWVVPLCITLGGSDVTQTPLYDTSFTNQANSSGTTYYHIQYLQNFDSTLKWPLLIEYIPELLPILILEPIPPDYFKVDLDGPPPLQKPLREQEYLEMAEKFLREQKWMEKLTADPIGIKLMIESSPVDREQERAEVVQKNVVITYKRQIEIEGNLINVLGDGGIIKIQLANDGTVIHASKVWREVEKVGEMVKVKPYKSALQEAQEELENPEGYRLDRWNWGYKEEPAGVKQTEMRIVYQFWYVPENPEDLLEYPPRMVEITGMFE